MEVVDLQGNVNQASSEVAVPPFLPKFSTFSPVQGEGLLGPQNADIPLAPLGQRISFARVIRTLKLPALIPG